MSITRSASSAPVGSRRADGPATGSNPRRPRWARRAAGGLAVLGVTALVAGCGSDDSSSSGSAPAATSAATSTTAAAGFTPSPGTDIPTTSVKFAMWPYGDTTLAVPGITLGWFKQVGIDLPNGKQTRTIQQTSQELLNNQLAVASGFVPNTIQTYSAAPKLKMFQLTNAYIGNYVWANPKLNAKTFADEGGSKDNFDAAAKATIQQMKGKKVALSDSGSNRQFFQTLLEMGGLTTKDLGNLTVVNDTKIVQLAKAGSIDFAFPGGAAQSVQIQGLGFDNLFGYTTMVADLPVGDSRVLTGIGHAGLQATDDYISKNRETVMRFMSVMFRIVDGLQNNPQEILKYSLPVLRTSTGVPLTLDQAVALFKDFYATVDFKQAADLLENSKYPLYYDSVYQAQIDAAKKGGIIKKGANVTPEDLSVMAGLYKDLVTMKNDYDALKAKSNPTGDLATKAATFYKNFDYLDAYRFLLAASKA